MSEIGAATCEVNVTSRSVAAVIVIGFVSGIVGLPLLVAFGVMSIPGFTDILPVVSGVLLLLVFIASLVGWIIVSRFIPKFLGIRDNVTLEDDKLVFQDRCTIPFKDIVAFNTDDRLKIRPRGKGVLLLSSTRREYRPFCRTFVRQLKEWSAAHPELDTPVQKYFYGSWMARTIGCGVLSLIIGVVAMSFILGIGTGAAVAIAVVSSPIPLKLALGKRPPAGRVDEVATTQYFGN